MGYKKPLSHLRPKAYAVMYKSISYDNGIWLYVQGYDAPSN